MATWLPGPQHPEKYPQIGPKYKKWGEMAHQGLSYDYKTDSYYADPVAQAKFEQQAREEAGLVQPEPPGIWEQALASTLPIAASAAGTYGIHSLLSPATAEAVKVAATPAATAASGSAVPVAASAGGAVSAPLTAGEAATEALMAGPVAAPVEGGVMIGPAAEGVLGGATTGVGAGLLGLGGYGLYKATQMKDKEKGLGLGLLGGGAMGLGGGMLVPSLIGAGPLGWTTLGLLGLGGAALGGGLGFGMAHKGTKDYQKERWGAITGENDPYAALNKQAWEAAHPEGDDGIYDAGPHKGQKWSFENDMEDIKTDPLGTGNLYLGNLETYDDWHTLSAEDRAEIIRRNAEAGNYWSDKGDVLIKDKATAQKIYDEVMKEEDENATV